MAQLYINARDNQVNKDKDALFGFIFLIAVGVAVFAVYKASEGAEPIDTNQDPLVVRKLQEIARGLKTANWLAAVSGGLLVIGIILYAFVLPNRMKNVSFAGFLFVTAIPMLIAGMVYIQYEEYAIGYSLTVASVLIILVSFITVIWLAAKDVAGKTKNTLNPMYWFRRATGNSTKEDRYRGTLGEYLPSMFRRNKGRENNNQNQDGEKMESRKSVFSRLFNKNGNGEGDPEPVAERG